MISVRSRARGLACGLLLVVGSHALAQATPLTLSDALAALPASPAWHQADLTYRSAADALAAARAAAGLSVSAGGSYDRTDTITGTGGRSGATAKVSISAATTVLPWAPAEASIANAEISLHIAALTRDSTRASLVLGLEQAYFAARLAATAQGVAQAADTQAQAKLAAARAQRAQGQLSAAGLAQAEATAAGASAALAQAQSSLELARQALFGTLGTPVTDAPLATSPPQAPGPTAALQQLLASAVGSRDDVKSAELRVAQAQATLSASAAERWIPSASLSVGVGGTDSTGAAAGPSVSAGLDFQKGVLSGTASYPVAPGTAATSTQLSVGVSVSIPLDAPSASAAVRSARTAVQSAQAALAATRSAAELDIRQRYASWQGARATLSADQASESAAKQSLDTVKAQLDAGLATSLDVGAAQVAYQQAQRTVESDQNALYLALLQLRNALGELQVPPGGQP